MATGMDGVPQRAFMLTDIEAPSLRDACRAYALMHPEWAKDWDAERMTYWGCRIFDNEQEARKKFG